MESPPPTTVHCSTLKGNSTGTTERKMVDDGSPHPQPPDRSKPLFPKCFYSAINDSYEIAFVGIIEFFERSLEEYSQHVALLKEQTPSSHCAPSTSGAEGETERYFRLPKTGEPLFATTGRNIYSAEALRDLVAKTSTTPVAIDPEAGKICRAMQTESQQQSQQEETETSIEHDTKCTLVRSPRELCDLVCERSAVSSSPTPTQELSVVSCGGRTCPHTQKLSPLRPTDKTVFSPSHLGISFNAGKDSMVMLHIVINAIERLVEIGDWVCERYGGGRGAVTLVKPHHMDLFREWRSVLANNSAVPRTSGDQKGRKCERSNPCHNPILSFLLSHLCIFYFEDKDEIEEMRVFIEALLDGLDFPVFTMANDGTLSVKPEGKSSHPGNDDQTTAGDDAIAARSADTTEFTPISGCGRFHSRNHHADCPLIFEAIRSPVGKQIYSISSLLSYSDVHREGQATEKEGRGGESAPAKAQRAASFRARPSVSGTSEVCSTQFSRRPLLYYGAKVICVAEGSGMSDGLALLKQHVGVHFAFLGVRCEDIVGWRQDPIEMTSKGWPTLLRLCPIFSWTYEQVWMYLFYYNVPFCHLYSMGITSCGPSARTVRNPQCIVPLEVPIPFSARALSRLHKDNLFDPCQHSVHPYDPRGVNTCGRNGQNATSSPSPCAIVNISTDRMWPAVCESASGAVLRDSWRVAFSRDTEDLRLDILSCWKLWWDVQAHGNKIEPLGKSTDAEPLVTARWDPAEVDFNASHFFKHVARKDDVTATDVSHDQHAPATTFLVDGGPYDPQSYSFIGLPSLVPDEQNEVPPEEGYPASVIGAKRALYALPAWLLREGALERQSRLPAPRKEQAVSQPTSSKSSL